MSNNFCLLDSQRFNENLQAVNLGKTLQNTILIDSNNNLLQNNTVNEQANNIQYINKNTKNQPAIAFDFGTRNSRQLPATMTMTA